MPMVQRVYDPDARGGMGDALPVRARRRKPSIERRFLRWECYAPSTATPASSRRGNPRAPTGRWRAYRP